MVLTENKHTIFLEKKYQQHTIAKNQYSASPDLNLLSLLQGWQTQPLVR